MRTLTDWFHWIPRVLCILAILFISMFALDAFAPGFKSIRFFNELAPFRICLGRNSHYPDDQSSLYFGGGTLRNQQPSEEKELLTQYKKIIPGYSE